MANGEHRRYDELERRAKGATIASAVVAAISVVIAAGSLIVSCSENKQQTETQKNAAAVDAMQAHLQLSADNAEVARHALSGVSKDEEQEKTLVGSYDNLSQAEKKYVWYASHALFTAETIYNLKGRKGAWEGPDDGSWESAASDFVRRHEPYIDWDTSGPEESSVCTEFTPGFIRFVESEIEEKKC